MLHYSQGVRGVLMVWGHLNGFIKKAGEKRTGGGGWRWSRGRIGKVQAHRFREDPYVYCCIWRATFGTNLVLNRVNTPTSPPPHMADKNKLTKKSFS